MDWWVWVLIAVVVGVFLLGVVARPALRRQRLRARFGPEYERAVEGASSRREAERELRERLKRHRELELRPLEPAAAEAYSRRWYEIQVRFVDTPAITVGQAGDLLEQVLRDRGYPVEGDLDERVGLVAVDHAEGATCFRAAQEIADRERSGSATTEDLRQAFVNYRVLFAALLDGRVNGDRVPEGSPPDARDTRADHEPEAPAEQADGPAVQRDATEPVHEDERAPADAAPSGMPSTPST